MPNVSGVDFTTLHHNAVGAILEHAAHLAGVDGLEVTVRFVGVGGELPYRVGMEGFSGELPRLQALLVESVTKGPESLNLGGNGQWREVTGEGGILVLEDSGSPFDGVVSPPGDGKPSMYGLRSRIEEGRHSNRILLQTDLL